MPSEGLDVKEQVRFTASQRARCDRAAELLTRTRGSPVTWSDVVREGTQQFLAELLGPLESLDAK